MQLIRPFCLPGNQPETRHSSTHIFHVPIEYSVFPTDPSLRDFPSSSVQPSKGWRGFIDKTEARVAPGSVQLYSEVVVHARSRAACQNKIPHKKGGSCLQLHLYKNLIFSKKKWSGNKLIKEGHILIRKIWIPHIERGFPSATSLLTKIYFLMEGVFWE